ncbi:MAG: DNA-methyltransferase [Actinomycetota bacterium]
MDRRRGTSTSNFGVSRRESHDATDFYARFVSPALSTDDAVLAPAEVTEPFVLGDARDMTAVRDGSVALVVTSPPYFAGKQYEEELEREGVPGSYLEYLDLLRDVFRECVDKLEPGGRIAVNVANLGRKPYRSLSADVIRILQDDLGLLLRGELIWQKGEGANGSCAWGSFRSATNPVLRDITERVVIASKGRFDRARSVKQRMSEHLPWGSGHTLTKEDFMELTLDLWSIAPESARRVGHPAPFPVELPEKLIRLYTFAGDLVLDPFMGSGSTLVAAARLGRRYVGYDLEPEYVEIARARVAALPAPAGPDAAADDPLDDLLDDASVDEEFCRRAAREGRVAHDLAARVLARAGFEITGSNKRVPRTGVAVSFEARDAAGAVWRFDVSGAFTSHRGGLLRVDTVWKSLGRVSALRPNVARDQPIVLLTTNLPRRPSEGDTALRAAGPELVFDVVGMLDPTGLGRLRHYAAGHHAARPEPGFWTAADLAQGNEPGD